VQTMLQKLQGKVKGIFLCTPSYMEPNRGDALRARLDVYGDICRTLSEQYHCIFVDFQSMYDRFFQYRHSCSIAWDRIHPNQMGSTLMAKEFLKQAGFDFTR